MPATDAAAVVTAAMLVLVAAAGVAYGSAPSGETSAAAKPAQTVSAVRTISWAEPAADGCEVDLEGTARPAMFRLRYRESGKPPVVIDSSLDRLFAEGWNAITRSARGMGFDRVARFEELDFHIVEQLLCSCEQRGGDPEAKSDHLVEVKLLWRPGTEPKVTGRTQGADGQWKDVRPVTTNGSLPVYDFRFAHPSPGGRPGECSSRFEATLAVDPPVE